MKKWVYLGKFNPVAWKQLLSPISAMQAAAHVSGGACQSQKEQENPFLYVQGF